MSDIAAGLDAGSGAPTVVTVVQAPACHFCADAETTLAGLAESYPLVLDLVDIRSDRGLAMMSEHRAPMSPLVLVDGAFFSSGRLPRRKLAALLEQRLAGSSVVAAGRRGQVG